MESMSEEKKEESGESEAFAKKRFSTLGLGDETLRILGEQYSTEERNEEAAEIDHEEAFASVEEALQQLEERTLADENIWKRQDVSSFYTPLEKRVLQTVGKVSKGLASGIESRLKERVAEQLREEHPAKVKERIRTYEGEVKRLSEEHDRFRSEATEQTIELYSTEREMSKFEKTYEAIEEEMSGIEAANTEAHYQKDGTAIATLEARHRQLSRDKTMIEINAHRLAARVSSLDIQVGKKMRQAQQVYARMKIAQFMLNNYYEAEILSGSRSVDENGVSTGEIRGDLAHLKYLSGIKREGDQRDEEYIALTRHISAIDQGMPGLGAEQLERITAYQQSELSSSLKRAHMTAEKHRNIRR